MFACEKTVAMAPEDYDILITGAGPAGAVLALCLAPTGMKIGVIDKAGFPRNKICGDALSGKVMRVLSRLPDDALQEFQKIPGIVPCDGIRFVAPNLKHIDLPFHPSQSSGSMTGGYLCDRMTFDHFLINRFKAFKNLHFFQKERFVSAEEHPDAMMIFTENRCFRVKMLAGADGINSRVRKILNAEPVGKRHYCLGVRGYFENISGDTPDRLIELIFLKTVLPGYVWIFPSGDGRFNVGLGWRQDQVIRQKTALGPLLSDLVKSHPALAARFRYARQLTPIQAHLLPLGTARIRRSGHRTLLLGDAACLVDPFTGEGIGNAMASGEVAAETIRNCFLKGDFSDAALKNYDHHLHRRVVSEFKTSALLQRLAGFSWLFNFVVNKANKNSDLKELLTAIYTSEEAKKKLTRPGFYIRALLR